MKQHFAFIGDEIEKGQDWKGVTKKVNKKLVPWEVKYPIIPQLHHRYREQLVGAYTWTWS